MISKGNAPNTVQKRWREDVRAVGCIQCGTKPTEIHHPAGATAKFNKQAIGHWWILPLCHPCHVLMGTPNDFSKQNYGFKYEGRWDCEKMLFADLLTHFHALPFTTNVLDAIWEYRR